MVWQSKTLGDLFPGMKGTAENLQVAADSVKDAFDAQLLSVQAKAHALHQVASSTTALLSDLAEAGFYINMLPPASGGYLDRIQSASGEVDAPPNSGYSAVLMITVAAPDVLEVAAKYQKLMNILSSTSPAT